MMNRVARQLRQHMERGVSSTAELQKILKKAVDELERLEHQI